MESINFFKLYHWIKHALKAKNQYSIHSPYMFELYNSCIKNNVSKIQRLIFKLENRFNRGNIIYIENIKDYNLLFNELNTQSDNRICIFYDQYKNKSRFDTFNQIKDHPNTRVSVDLFNLSLFINNPILKKQNYILR